MIKLRILNITNWGRFPAPKLNKESGWPSMKKCMFLMFLFISLIAFGEEGYLKLKANLNNVKIEVGQTSKNIGTEWSFISLSPGRHQITASKRHYQPQTKIITVNSGRVSTIIFNFEKPSGFKVEKPRDVTVVKGYGDLTIVTDIPGATITLNGQPVSGEVTPITVKELAEGEWTVKVTQSGKTLSKEITVKPKTLQTVRFFFSARNRAAYEKALNAQKLKAKMADLNNRKAILRKEIMKNNPKRIMFSSQDRSFKNTVKCFNSSGTTDGRLSNWYYEGGWITFKGDYISTYKHKSDIASFELQIMQHEDTKKTVLEKPFLGQPKYSKEGTIVLKASINGKEKYKKSYEFSSSAPYDPIEFETDQYICKQTKERNKGTIYVIIIKNYDSLINALVNKKLQQP